MPDHDALSEAFWHGVAQFNKGEFYACHDTLEALWMEANEVQKPFFQGILQIAVAFYHLGNRNWHGATVLLGEGTYRLHPFEPDYGDVAVTVLIDQATAWLVELQQGGPDRIEHLAAGLNDVAAELSFDLSARDAVPASAMPPETAFAQVTRLPVPKIQRVARLTSS
jgi:hypothetical protein